MVVKVIEVSLITFNPIKVQLAFGKAIRFVSFGRAKAADDRSIVWRQMVPLTKFIKSGQVNALGKQRT